MSITMIAMIATKKGTTLILNRIAMTMVAVVMKMMTMLVIMFPTIEKYVVTMTPMETCFVVSNAVTLAMNGMFVVKMRF